jgi:hypothetical protein
MDVGKAFVFMFEDRNWIVKILIGGGILLLGLLFSWVLLIPLIAAGAILLGYALQVTRNVYDGNPNPLPEWTNFGELFSKGGTALVGSIIWYLPVIVLSVCYALSFIAAGAAADDGGSGAASFAGLLGTCFLCLTIIAGVAISVFIYAPLTNFALTNQMSTFWDFRGNLRFIQANAGNYLIAWLLGVVVAGLIGGVVAAVTCGLLSTFASFWGYLVGAHLFGQVARQSLAPSDSSLMTPPPGPSPMMPGPSEPVPTT